MKCTGNVVYSLKHLHHCHFMEHSAVVCREFLPFLLVSVAICHCSHVTLSRKHNVELFANGSQNMPSIGQGVVRIGIRVISYLKMKFHHGALG